MAKNLLVINVDIRETRVALIENGIIAELHIERESSKGTLGNIYLGKVSRVLPGMQAAFIDVGLERAAFLHVEDLIRPDDFEAYLSGHRHGGAHDEERPSASSSTSVSVPAAPASNARLKPEADDEPPPDEPTIDEPLDAYIAPTPDGESSIELPTALDVADIGDEPIADEDGDQDEAEASPRGEPSEADEGAAPEAQGAASLDADDVPLLDLDTLL